MSDNGNFVRAAEDVKLAVQSIYSTTNATEQNGKAQTLAILALAYAMKDIADAIEGNASAVRYASR